MLCHDINEKGIRRFETVKCHFKESKYPVSLIGSYTVMVGRMKRVTHSLRTDWRRGLKYYSM